MQKSLGYSQIWLPLVLCFCGCSTTYTTPQSQETFPGQQPSDARSSNESNKDVEPDLSGFFHGNPKGEEAWKRFIKGSTFRLARASDFKFSDAAKKDIARGLGPEWATKIGNPYTGGEINHDKYYKDLAFIVVETTRNDIKHFGLIVFNEGPKDHKAYWLYQDKDLSATIFDWGRDGLHLMEYHEDGSYSVCDIKWHKQSMKYTCDKPF